MSKLLPLIVIVAVGFLGVVLRRSLPMWMRRLLVGGSALAMLIFALTDSPRRYAALLFALLGAAFVFRTRAGKAGP